MNYTRHTSNRSWTGILIWIFGTYGFWQTPLLVARRFVHLVYIHATRRKAFRFRNRQYRYCQSIINKAYANERTVEVPIIRCVVQQAKRILEIGHVLRNYGCQGHAVVDKYETDIGVLNVDILDYDPEVFYDCIVSISTFEHIGWDEAEREPNKVFSAIEKARSLLSPHGILWITVPLGYNPILDARIRERSLGATEMGFLKRINMKNEWMEVSLEQAIACHYDSPYRCANAIAILSFTRPTEPE